MKIVLVAQQKKNPRDPADACHDAVCQIDFQMESVGFDEIIQRKEKDEAGNVVYKKERVYYEDGRSMIRETNIVCLKDFEHPELLHGIVKKYNEMQKR